MRDHFEFRKKNQLAKDDKSLKQSWDDKVVNLCNKLNDKKEYYTTSSCSGRVVLIKKSKIKSDDLFVFVSHNKINLKELKDKLENIEKEDLIYFKQDPVILHVACNTLENAQKLIDIASKEAGWKRCSIIASNKRFVVELNSTEKLEFPIFHNKLLVDDAFLELVIKEANTNLEFTWDKIDKLEKIIQKDFDN